MKKSVRLYLTGAVQWMFFKGNIKKLAEEHNLYGFARKKEDGKIEIFLEGDNENVDKMVSLCKAGLPNSTMKMLEQKNEKFQDFREFKILNF